MSFSRDDINNLIDKQVSSFEALTTLGVDFTNTDSQALALLTTFYDMLVILKKDLSSVNTSIEDMKGTIETLAKAISKRANRISRNSSLTPHFRWLSETADKRSLRERSQEHRKGIKDMEWLCLMLIKQRSISICLLFRKMRESWFLPFNDENHSKRACI